MKTPSISVVMPSYNERENITEAVRRIGRTLGESLLEIIVVDDDSPDRTWEAVEQMNDPRARAIRRIGERGLPSALGLGTREARGDIVVWMDCDLGIPPEVIPRLVEKIGEYDAAIGSRYVPGGKDDRPWVRTVFSVILNRMAQLLLDRRVKDYTSGFSAVKREVMREVPIAGGTFGDYYIDWLYRCVKKGYRVAEVGYVYGLRKSGVSKTDSNVFRFFELGIKYAWRVVRIRFGK